MSSPCITPAPPSSVARSSSISALSPNAFKAASACPQYTHPSPSSRTSGDGSSASSQRPLAETSKTSPIINAKKRPSPQWKTQSPVPSASRSPASTISQAPSITTVPTPASSSTTVPESPLGRNTVTAGPSEPAPATSPKRQRADQTWKVLPKAFQFCPNADLVVLISDMLSELVALNDRIPLSGAGLTRFHSRAPPTISISDYLNRLSVHASLQPSILLAMVYYIDVLSTHYSPFVISSLTVHRFLITAATVASKGLCDTFLTNSFYAKVGGITIMELNVLELEFLVRVNWRIVPKFEILAEYYSSLVGRLAARYRIEGDAGG